MKKLKDLPIDKRRHFLLGILVSWAGSIVTLAIWNRYMIVGAILSVFTASIIWEVARLYKSPFSWLDVRYAMMGSIPVIILWMLMHILDFLKIISI